LVRRENGDGVYDHLNASKATNGFLRELFVEVRRYFTPQRHDTVAELA